MGILDYFRKKPLCHENCWYYGCFGGVEGCDVQNGNWGGWPEPIEPGQKCLYPKKRHICQPVIVSSLEVYAALEGAIVLDPKTGEPGPFVKMLLDSKDSAR